VAALACTNSFALATSQQHVLTHPSCEASGGAKLALDCTFPVKSANRDENGPQIALKHLMIKFRPDEESDMSVELKFENVSKTLLDERRTVYIELDDANRMNYIRRPLPSVDLREVKPGTSKSFHQTLLVPALRPNTYYVRLWIPSPDPAMKFDSRHNFLLAGTDVEAGTNQIAVVTVTQ